MLYPSVPEAFPDLDVRFVCKTLNERIPTAMCIDWFVDHNSHNYQKSPCFKCKQGQQNREAFSQS